MEFRDLGLRVSRSFKESRLQIYDWYQMIFRAHSQLLLRNEEELAKYGQWEKKNRKFSTGVSQALMSAMQMKLGIPS